MIIVGSRREEVEEEKRKTLTLAAYAGFSLALLHFVN